MLHRLIVLLSRHIMNTNSSLTIICSTKQTHSNKRLCFMVTLLGKAQELSRICNLSICSRECRSGP